MLTKILPVNSPDEKINESQVSALANAAKISHMVNETTIGALSRQQSRAPIQTTTKNMNNVQRQQSSDPWKRDVWRAVDLETEKKRSSGSTINLMDCKAIQIKMALRNADRMRQKQVRLEMAQRQNKLNQLEEMMESLKIDLAKKSAKKLQKNLLLKEEQIVKVVRQIETNSQIAEEQAKREMEEHSRKMTDKFNRLKQEEEIKAYFQSIVSLKDLFIILFEKFVKTCIANQQHLKNFEQYTEARESYLTRYDSLIKLVNSGRITSAEVDTFESICDDIKEMQRAVDEELTAAEELERTIADQKEQQQQEQYLQQQQQQQEQHHHQQHQQRTNTVDATDTPNIIAASTDSTERLHHYRTILKFYEEYVEFVKPLLIDEEMKRFRFDCKKCVSFLSNSICATTPEHLRDKYDRFALILSGNSVQIGNARVTPSQHPLGIRFVNLEVAKVFVKQAGIEIASNPGAAFPISSLIVALWQKFPDFGKLFLACLYKESPLLVPYYIHQVDDFKKSIGYKFEKNECEPQETFLKRLSGLVRLYFSVIVTTSNKPHPHGIEFAWIWLTNALNLTPLPDVSATMLHEFIIIAGSELLKTYDKQFVKLLNTLASQYSKKLHEIGTGGPKARLDGMIEKIIQEKKISPPEDMLPANFW